MGFFLNTLKQSSSLSALLNALESGSTPVSISGCADIHKAHITAAALSSLGGKNLLLCRNERLGRQICRDINAFSGRETAIFYPERDMCFSLSQTSSREYEQERLSALLKLYFGSASLLVAPVSAALEYSVSPSLFESGCFTFKTGDTLCLSSLTDSLILGGYTRRAQLDGVGQFSIRGGIVDIFCPSYKKPVRIELWDDEIDSIAPFDLDTQRRQESLQEFTLTFLK